MKRVLLGILCVVLFLGGAGVMLYPTISNAWNEYRQAQLISDYEAKVSEITPEDLSAEWEKARAYNASVTQNNIFADAFDADAVDHATQAYWEALNITGDGTMGYLTIPKINVKISINHGTADDVLQNSIGHLSGSKLPIGGEGNHAVLAAHRGLPSAKLFSDLDKMEVGDVFYLNILDEVMAYQVDQILPMVEKDDNDTLSRELQCVEGKDYVTLFTCTPYGVNSHRLLVRGSRIPYIAEEDLPAEQQGISGTSTQTQDDAYTQMMLIGGAIAAVVLIVLVVLIVTIRSRRRKKQRKQQGDDSNEEE